MYDTEFFRLGELWYDRCRLQQGEKVVILADSGTYPHAVDAFFSVALSRGTDAVLARFPRPRQPFSDVPSAIERALLDADFIHQLLSFVWSCSPSRARVIRKIQTTGQGRMTWGGNESTHLEVPPDERVIERTLQAAKLIDGAREIRITSQLGTDLRWRRGDPTKQPVLRHGGDIDQPGRIGSLNGGIAYSAEEGSANGVAYVNGGVEPIDAAGTPAWMLGEPVRIEVARGRIAKIDSGGRDGRRLAQWFEAINDNSMLDFVHTNLGLDHRARFREVQGGLSHSHSAWGGILLAFGRNVNPLFGLEHLAPGHVDLFLKSHNYFIDGRQIMTNGQYTEDSGLA